MQIDSVLVTGASRGIGRAIAVGLAQEGRQIILTSRNEKDLAKVAEEIEAKGAKPRIFPGDLTQIETLKTLETHVNSDWGGVDVLVNNAGYLGQGSVTELDFDEFSRMLDLNVRALAFLTKACSVSMKKKKRGAIINIASIAGVRVVDGVGGYCTSKFAARAFSEAAFSDLRSDGIKVCAICPGYVATDMTDPFGLDASKMIQPEDIQSTVEFVLRSGPTMCPREIHLMPQQEQD